ncbi:MAG: 2-oxoacid:acceptor oxidoreductase subunit alpha, partial [Deltaproteobacteria bacterium]
MNALNICICGEAGQGLVTVGQLLSKSLVRTGYHIVVTQSYQSRIRGGHNAFYIRVSPAPVAAPADDIDVLVTLNEEGIVLHREEMAPDGWVLCDAAYGKSGERVLSIPYAEIGEGGEFLNIAAFAVIGALLGLDAHFMGEMVREAFGKKGNPATMEKNLSVLE